MEKPNPKINDIFLIMFEEYNYLFKIVVIGDSGVGKTNLVSKFIDNSFHLDEKPTIGVEFSSKTIRLNSQDIRCQIWDTAGQERFRALTKAYYNGAVGALVVFDLTNSQTFENITKWIEEAQQNTKQNTLILLVGNKVDLPNRAVSQSTVNNFLDNRSIGMLYIETSALTGQNVNEAFQKLVQNIYVQKKSDMDVIKSQSPRKDTTPLPSEIFQNPISPRKEGHNPPTITLKSEVFANKNMSPIKPPKKPRKKCC